MAASTHEANVRACVREYVREYAARPRPRPLAMATHNECTCLCAHVGGRGTALWHRAVRLAPRARYRLRHGQRWPLTYYSLTTAPTSPLPPPPAPPRSAAAATILLLPPFLIAQVSAGGNLGAVVLLSSFFEAGTLRLDEGFLRLGMVVCGLTTLLVFVYFPDHGSMLLRARALGARYDPQLIKPPSDYRGADSVRMFVLGQVLVIGQ